MQMPMHKQKDYNNKHPYIHCTDASWGYLLQNFYNYNILSKHSNEITRKVNYKYSLNWLTSHICICSLLKSGGKQLIFGSWDEKYKYQESFIYMHTVAWQLTMVTWDTRTVHAP